MWTKGTNLQLSHRARKGATQCRRAVPATSALLFKQVPVYLLRGPLGPCHPPQPRARVTQQSPNAVCSRQAPGRKQEPPLQLQTPHQLLPDTGSVLTRCPLNMTSVSKKVSEAPAAGELSRWPPELDSDALKDRAATGRVLSWDSPCEL